MKDEINLITTFNVNRESGVTGTTDLWELRLKLVNAIVAVFLFFCLIGTLTVTALEKSTAKRTIKNEDEITSLSADSIIITSLINRQMQLKTIKENSPNLREGVESIQRNIPQNVRLNNLSISAEKTSLTAETGSIQSFSQFIDSLKKTGLFKTIYLTTSSYDDNLNLFYFTLECFVT